MTSNAELEIAVQYLANEVIELKAQVAELTKTEAKWLTPDAASRKKDCPYSAYRIRALVDRAIENPLDSKLVSGTHYARVFVGSEGKRGQWRYSIAWPSFKDVLIDTT